MIECRLRRAGSVAACFLLASCAAVDSIPRVPDSSDEVLLTSASGEKMAQLANVVFEDGPGAGVIIEVDPDSSKQIIDGIGSSFTESSAFVLAHLPIERRHALMKDLYGEAGANFSLTRTHIGSCDFSVEGKYSYADEAGDLDLSSFSIAPDREGFDPERYPGVQDPDYDLLPMIREALEIKGQQSDSTLRIIASAWTAPPWMKDIETWWVPASAENQWQGDAGSLEPQYVSTYAEYLAKFVQSYERAGVEIWGLTPVNEPHGNGGNWESMHFTPGSQNEFVQGHLSPALERMGFADTHILVYDQNRDGLEEWADTIFADPRSRDTVYGAAVHWYASTVKVYEDVFERVHAAYPDFALVHTEGCIDNLGNPAPGGIADPEGFQESGWFDNDSFWWQPNATDWAYTATWAGPGVVDHPKYVPVHRYARNIIVSLDHWVTGWVDWNVVLDRNGGPNHVNNFCGAPIMVDTSDSKVYYTPIYYVLAQFSRTIRPGDRALQTRRVLGGLDSDALHACATINDEGLMSVQLLNTTASSIALDLQIRERHASVELPANAVQTIRVQLPR